MLRQLQAFFRLWPMLKRVEELSTMKMTTGVFALMGIEIIRGINALTDILPPRTKFWAYAVTLFIGLMVQIIAHVSNPDGTSAAMPDGLTDEQLKKYREQFTKAVVVLLCLALCAPLATAQVVDPKYVYGAGAGWNDAASPRANGWLFLAGKVQDGGYTTGAIDLTGRTVSSRIGYERILLRLGGIVLSGNGDAGMISSQDNIGAAFGGGGSALIPIGKLFHMENLYLIGRVSMLKTAVAGSGVQPVFRLGFAQAR